MWLVPRSPASFYKYTTKTLNSTWIDTYITQHYHEQQDWINKVDVSRKQDSHKTMKCVNYSALKFTSTQSDHFVRSIKNLKTLKREPHICDLCNWQLVEISKIISLVLSYKLKRGLFYKSDKVNKLGIFQWLFFTYMFANSCVMPGFKRATICFSIWS